MRTGSIGSQQFTSSGVRGSSVTVSGNRDNAGTADERRTTRLQQPTTGVVEAAGVEEIGTGSLAHIQPSGGESTFEPRGSRDICADGGEQQHERECDPNRV